MLLLTVLLLLLPLLLTVSIVNSTVNTDITYIFNTLPLNKMQRENRIKLTYLGRKWPWRPNEYLLEIYVLFISSSASEKLGKVLSILRVALDIFLSHVMCSMMDAEYFLDAFIRSCWIKMQFLFNAHAFKCLAYRVSTYLYSS